MAPSGGFVKLTTVIAAVLGLGFGASAFLNYAQHQRAAQDERLLQGQITDLRYQVNQDHTSPSPTPSAAPTDTPSPEPSTSPAVAGSAVITISQFGVKLTAADPITDLTYAPIRSGGLTVAGLTTRSLVGRYPKCTAGAALGMLVRRPASQTPPAHDQFVKTIGAYKYYYVPSTTACATDSPGSDTLAADRTALTAAVIPTLSN